MYNNVADIAQSFPCNPMKKWLIPASSCLRKVGIERPAPNKGV
jgi:hypothetical protein